MTDFIYPKKVMNARVLHMFAVLIYIVINVCKSKALNVTNVDGLFVSLKLATSAVASVSSYSFMVALAFFLWIT